MQSKHKLDFRKLCFEMFTRAQVVNTHTVMEPLGNLQETPYSKSDISDKLSILARNLSFLQ